MAGRPGLYMINSTFNTISLLVTSLKFNAGIVKNSLGSLVVKHMVRGEGREEKGSKYKRVQFYTDLFQV